MEPNDARLFSSPILDHLSELHHNYSKLKEGRVATYIPELAKANPDWFGITLVTATGAVYEVGDSRQSFTIQSISKPFVYGMALEDHGRTTVLQKVGVEPTGDAFNSISLDPITGRPRNPMINAGAIATAGMILGKTRAARIRRVLTTLGLCAGRSLGINEPVYRSESETGHRNRAIGHMLRNFDILGDDPIPVVEAYFQQCAISITCHDLGIMAATLANRGVNPLTGKQALRGEYVESVLSVMGSCGMYDYAGEWIYNIGMPAKSGVSGGVIAVLPGQLGIGVFSPPLDARGNSVRGIAICSELSRHLDLHVLNRPSVGATALRLRTTGAEMSSNHVRTDEENRVLRNSGSAITIYHLQGNLTFTSTEAVVREVTERLPSLQYLVFDFKRVLSLNESTCHLFYRLLTKASALKKHILFVHANRWTLLRRYMKAKLGNNLSSQFRVFDDAQPALEWCENRLLEQHFPGWTCEGSAKPEDYQLFVGLSPSELAQLVPKLQRRSYQEKDVIIRVGEKANALYFLARGNVSVLLEQEDGRHKRLATFSAGMTFGEMAVLDGAQRCARIVADSEVECDFLAVQDFAELDETHPSIKIKLLKNLSLDLCRKLRSANRVLSVFD